MGMKNVRPFACALIVAAVFTSAGCPVEGPAGPGLPIEGISIERNRNPVGNEGIILVEGKSADLTAVLRPAGVYAVFTGSPVQPKQPP
jgi:hypothetical protein